MNSLLDETIVRTLSRLQNESKGDSRRWTEDKTTSSDDLVRMGDLYLAVSEEEGKLLYLLARSSGAKRIVEFGASYGISTIYLAAAARDNNGRLITTEVHPKKCAAISENIHMAGLSDVFELLEGDARETLLDLDEEVDFVFLDGWKGMYLQVLEILRPKLVRGAVVVADNVSHRAAQDYCAYVRDPASGFTSSTLGEQELSCYLGSD